MRRLGTGLLFTALALPLTGCTLGGGSGAGYASSRQKAMTQLHMASYSEARASFEELIKRYPEEPFNEEARLLLADCEFRLGNEAKGRSLREQVAREGSTPEIKARALFGLGMMDLWHDGFDAAARRFDEAAKMETDPARRSFYLCEEGRAQRQAGRFAEARETLKQGAAVSPGTNIARSCERQLLLPDYFAVQTGAFRDPANAASQRELLVKKGFPAEVIAIETPGGKRHCVWVGRFSDRASAIRLGERLQSAKVLPESTKLTIRP